MNDKTASLYRQIISILSADSIVTAYCSDRIFTHVPPNIIYPYIRLSIQAQNDGDFTENSLIYTLQIQIFDNRPSPNNILEQKKYISSLLDRQESIINQSENLISSVQIKGPQQCFLEDDGTTWQTIITYEIY